MPTTTKMGIVYPASTDLVKDGATAMGTISTTIDAKTGLILLSTTSFSAQSSVSVSNFTTASYSKYRVVVNATGTVTGANLRFRFRENVTDKSTGYYGAGGYARYTGTFALYTNENNGTFFNLSALDTAIHTAVGFDFYKPISTLGIINGNSYDANLAAGVFYSFDNRSMTDVTGFTIYPSSGNMTGKVSVFAYNE